MMTPVLLKVEPLARETFAHYGDVIEKPGARVFATNGGQAERYPSPPDWRLACKHGICRL